MRFILGTRFRRPLPAECPRCLGLSSFEIAMREATLDILSHTQACHDYEDHYFTSRRLAYVCERAAEIEEIHQHHSALFEEVN